MKEYWEELLKETRKKKLRKIVMQSLLPSWEQSVKEFRKESLKKFEKVSREKKKWRNPWNPWWNALKDSL